MEISHSQAKSILTRSSGYLSTVSSHSLQPYVGCTFGRSLCGVGCYAQHNRFTTKGRAWGRFLEVKDNAAELYLRDYPRERRFAHRHCGRFGVYMSSVTDPFLPHERRYGISRAVLRAMVECPPDLLILQTHSHRIAAFAQILGELNAQCALRAHISIESDRDRLPGLPAPACSVADRFAAASTLKAIGLTVVITVSPLLPIAAPEAFFRRIAKSADAVVLDHFVGGDGSHNGRRTRATALPQAMSASSPRSVHPSYLEEMTAVAERCLPGRVGIGPAGFAGHMLETPGRA